MPAPAEAPPGGRRPLRTRRLRDGRSPRWYRRGDLPLHVGPVPRRGCGGNGRGPACRDGNGGDRDRRLAGASGRRGGAGRQPRGPARDGHQTATNQCTTSPAASRTFGNARPPSSPPDGDERQDRRRRHLPALLGRTRCPPAGPAGPAQLGRRWHPERSSMAPWCGRCCRLNAATEGWASTRTANGQAPAGGRCP